MNAPFKITVAAEHRDGHHIVVFDRRADVFRQRPAVADARGAAVAHELKLKFVEILRQSRSMQVIGHYFRARRQTRFHPRLGAQPALHRFFRQQRRAEHQRWIRRVGATGDGRDDHRAAGQIEGVAVVAQLHVLRGRAVQHFHKRRFRLPQRHAILRTLGSRERWFHAAQIQFQGVAEDGIRGFIRAEQRLLLAIGLDQRHLLLAARGEFQIREGFRVHGKKSHGRAIFRGHVRNRGTVGNAQARKAGAVELHEFSDDTFLAQHLRHRQHQIGGRRALAQAPV